MADVIGWIDPDDLTADWAVNADEGDLHDALAAAHEQCVEFLGGRDPLTRVAGNLDLLPKRFRLAQVKQARALLASDFAGPSDEAGMEGLTVTVFPMDWTVRNLLRPKRGKRYVR